MHGCKIDSHLYRYRALSTVHPSPKPLVKFLSLHQRDLAGGLQGLDQETCKKPINIDMKGSRAMHSQP